MSFQQGDERLDFQVACPYNNSHRMPFAKLQFHITNACSDRLIYGHLYDTCPYYGGHIIIKEEMANHIITCPKKPQSEDGGDIFLEMKKAASLQFAGQQKQKQPQNGHQVPGYLPPQPKSEKAKATDKEKKKKSKPAKKQKQGQTKQQQQPEKVENNIPQWGQDSAESDSEQQI